MSDLNGKLITIFGGGGFVGRYVAQACMARGARVRIAQRDIASANFIKPLGNLGQVQLIPADVRNIASVARAVAGADMVINLVGSFDNMDAIQHIGAANVAREAAKAKVSALVHLSAIGADSDSAANYGRSKAAGEAAVRKAFPSATILRPSIIFGREDAFINRFAALIRMLPIVPVIGAQTRFQPVFVGDVAKAVVAALMGDGSDLLELGGPRVMTMRSINEWIANATGREKIFIDVPDFAASALALTTGWLPAAPITRDQMKMLAHDNIVDPARDGLAKLGIAATPIEAVAHDWLNIYRKHGRFGDTHLKTGASS